MAIFNVLDAPYSAKADAVKLTDAVVASGSDIVQSASAQFVNGDVGKIIWANDTQGAGVTLPQTTIIARIDATHVQVAAPAIANASNQVCVFGSDDTTPFQNAFAAALAAYRGGSVTGLIEIPSAGYINSARWYRNQGGGVPAIAEIAGPCVRGDGKNQSQLYMAPNFTVPGDGTPALMQNIGFGAEWSGLTIDGCDSTFATASGQLWIQVAQAADFRVSDLDIRNLGLGSGSYAWGMQGTRFGHVSDLTVQNQGIVGLGGGMIIDDAQGVFVNCFSSNTVQNLTFNNCKDRSPLTAPLTWIAGGCDEGVATACQLLNSDVNMSGIVNFCGIDPPSYAFYVDPTSRLCIDNGNVGRFLGYVGQNRPLWNQGTVLSRNTNWRGNGAPGGPVRFMINEGEFYDLGGNTYQRWTNDTTFVDVVPADCFSGHQPRVLGSWFPNAQVPR